MDNYIKCRVKCVIVGVYSITFIKKNHQFLILKCTARYYLGLYSRRNRKLLFRLSKLLLGTLKLLIYIRRQLTAIQSTTVVNCRSLQKLSNSTKVPFITAMHST